MGYSVLYIAFGIVALWLLGEVLLQYKARLRWRVLAFAGFMGVVLGVASRQVVLIVAGALAFGAGQTLVTLSYKKGFSTGWALGGRPGSSRRRKGATPRAARPVLAVSPVEEETGLLAAQSADMPSDGADELADGAGRPAGQQPEQVYRPEPMHDDSGEYPVFDSRPAYTPDPYTSGGYEGYGAQGYEGWTADPQPAAASYDAGYQQQTAGEQGYGGWGGNQDYGYDPAAAATTTASYDGYGYPPPDPQGYGYGTGSGGGDWTPAPAPSSYGGQQTGTDPYAAYGYDPQAQQQPYIPQQQPPYETQSAYEPQPAQTQVPVGEYADPYDPYRY